MSDVPGKTNRRVPRAVWGTVALTAALAATSCAASPPMRSAGRAATVADSSSAAPTHPPHKAPAKALPQPGWSVLTRDGRGVVADRRQVRMPDGDVITVLRLRAGLTRFALHAGSADPGPAALSVVRRGSHIGPSERRRLVAAFNGGFLLSTGSGGYVQEGHVIRPLVPGDASLVIDRSGKPHVVKWRPSDQQRMGAFSVRQNLTPLVSGGRPSRFVNNVMQWGATLGGGPVVARSAVGQDRRGNLLYAAGMAATPADLATALVHTGARIGMELDINPEWVQCDVARRPGGSLAAAIPGQVRPATQYLTGWTRDFVVALAR